MLDNINIHAKGRIRIAARKEGELDWSILIDKENTILSGAYELIAQCLALNPDFKLNNIVLYNGVTLEAVGTISNITHPAPGSLGFIAIIDPAGTYTFDNIKLVASIPNVEFAAASGFSINKPAGTSISITWIINIIA